MLRIFQITTFLLIVSLSATAQNKFLGTLEYGNLTLKQRNFSASTAGDKLYIMSEYASFIADLSKGGLTEIHQQFGVQLDPGNGDLFLLRNPFGLYKPTESGLELVNSLDGEDSYPYTYASATAGDVAFFKYRNNELWVTNGTSDGTKKFRVFNHPIHAIAVMGDTVHCITLGSVSHHYAINRVDRGEVNSAVPGKIQSNRLFSDEFLELKYNSVENYQNGWYFYSLTDRSIKFVAAPPNNIPRVPAEDMKSINGYLYGTAWDVWPINASRSNYIYNVDIQNSDLNLIYSAPEPVFMSGYTAVFGVKDQLLMLGSIGEKGSEVYRISETGQPQLVKDIYTGWAGSLLNGEYNNNEYEQSIVFNDKLYFAAQSPFQGAELWRTDGTESGTLRMSDFEPGAGGIHWLSLFSSDDKLYCMTRNRENMFSIYQIDDKSDGFTRESESDNDMVWDRYFLRHGSSYEEYMSPLREPLLVSTSSGFTGLLSGIRHTTSANYYDKFVEVDGDFELEIPSIPWSNNANLLYFLNKEGRIDTAFFIIAEGANCTMSIDSQSEDIYMTFGHEDKTYFGKDSIIADGAAVGLAKLSPQGKLLWYRFFDKGKGLFIHAMDMSSDKVFISGYYANATLSLGNGIILHPNYNKQYFVAAFDLNGEAIWAVNTSMEGLTKYSTLGQIRADETTGIVYAASSEHNLNMLNSCGYDDWKSRIVALKMLSGEEIWSEDLDCDDMLRLRDITTDALGNLWIAGNFRGNLSFENSKLRAKGENDCPVNAFVAVMNGKTGKVLNSFSIPEIHKRSRKILARDGFVDIVYLNAFLEPDDALQPMAHQRVSYLEKETYTLTGKWVGTERFPTPIGVYHGGYSNEDDASIKATICNVGKTHYALQLAYFNGGALGLGTRRAPPYLGSKSTTTTIQRKNPDFQLPEDFSDEPYSNVGFSIYPNPVSDGWISLVIDPDRLGDFDTMTFSDVRGRIVWKVALDTRYYSMQYSISPLVSGVYIVTLRGANNSGSQRLMVVK